MHMSMTMHGTKLVGCVINILSKRRIKNRPDIEQRAGKLQREFYPSCMANAELRANSAKENKNYLQDVLSLLSDNYSKINLVLPKEIAQRRPLPLKNLNLFLRNLI